MRLQPFGTEILSQLFFQTPFVRTNNSIELLEIKPGANIHASGNINVHHLPSGVVLI